MSSDILEQSRAAVGPFVFNVGLVREVFEEGEDWFVLVQSLYEADDPAGLYDEAKAVLYEYAPDTVPDGNEGTAREQYAALSGVEVGLEKLSQYLDLLLEVNLREGNGRVWTRALGQQLVLDELLELNEEQREQWLHACGPNTDPIGLCLALSTAGE